MERSRVANVQDDREVTQSTEVGSHLSLKDGGDQKILLEKVSTPKSYYIIPTIYATKTCVCVCCMRHQPTHLHKSHEMDYFQEANQLFAVKIFSNHYYYAINLTLYKCISSQ